MQFKPMKGFKVWTDNQQKTIKRNLSTHQFKKPSTQDNFTRDNIKNN